jgi:hypothetical protein
MDARFVFELNDSGAFDQQDRLANPPMPARARPGLERATSDARRNSLHDLSGEQRGFAPPVRLEFRVTFFSSLVKGSSGLSARHDLIAPLLRSDNSLRASATSRHRLRRSTSLGLGDAGDEAFISILADDFFKLAVPHDLGVLLLVREQLPIAELPRHIFKPLFYCF